MLTFEGEVGIGATGIGDKHRALRVVLSARRGLFQEGSGTKVVRGFYRALQGTYYNVCRISSSNPSWELRRSGGRGWRFVGAFGV